MIKYFNFRSSQGVETVDELNSNDFATFKEFRKELKRLVGEYHLAGMNVYTSSRACKGWND